MGLFGKKHEGSLMDEIRCDETSYLIWRWRPSSQASSDKRASAIRLGSSLHVKDGSVAVFINSVDNGRQFFIVGPYDGILTTKNIPLLADLIGNAYDGGTPFPAEIYFINLAQIVQVKFGVPYFDVFDPRYYEFGVPVAVRGSITFRIEDYETFVKLHGLNDFDLAAFQGQIRGAVARLTKGIVANAPAMNDIPVMQIESRILEINDLVEAALRLRLEKDFGVSVTSVDIEAVEIDKRSEGYEKLNEITRDITSATIRANAQAEIRNIGDMQRIDADDYSETLRIRREEGQYAQRLQTRQQNMEAFKESAKADAAIAGVEALGNLGSSGGDCVGGGLSPAGVMASLSLGGAVARDTAGLMGDMIGSVTQPSRTTTPPPVPSPLYNVVIDGQSKGPFSIDQLKEMVLAGTINRQSYVWTQGMAGWERAGMVHELSAVLALHQSQTPPPIPPDAL